MPFIKIIAEEDATGKLKEVYQNIINSRGKLSNIMKIHSLLPDTMIKHLELYLSIMFSKSNLSREEKEILAVVVSKTNHCAYCVNHHTEALNHYWKSPERLANFTKNLDDSIFSSKLRSAINYTLKLTATPSGITDSDVTALRKEGWTDEDILTINLIVSYFNFVNRIALGLGVEFSEKEVKGYKY